MTLTTVSMALACAFLGTGLGLMIGTVPTSSALMAQELDANRADRVIRAVLARAAGVMLVPMALAVLPAYLSGSLAGAIVAASGALFAWFAGWAVSPRTDPKVPGVRRRFKTQRVVSAALIASSGLIAIVAIVLVVLGV